MAKRGRRRRSGYREPNGRLSRSDARELEIRRNETLGPALHQRLRFVRKGENMLADAMSERMGTPLGRLLYRKVIELHHYDAGVEYNQLCAAYGFALGVPSPHPKAATLLASFGLVASLDDITPERIQRIRTRYDDAYECLHDCGRKVLLAVNALVIHEQETDVGVAKRGLSALAQHFGYLKAA